MIRRLNRVEYNHTISDLFYFQKPPTYFNPAQGMPERVRLVLHRLQPNILVDLPPDDTELGYENIAQALSLPPLLMEKYLQAAREVVSRAGGHEQAGRRSRVFFGRPRNATDRKATTQILESFARRAFRRPLDAGEVDRLLKLYDLAIAQGETHERALEIPFQAVLASPHFLFRIEGLADPADSPPVVPVSQHELAARLSYFLWSSLPDEELFAAADAGRLREPEELERQVRRMLTDPRVKALSDNFVVQWLQVTGVEQAMPDPQLFPAFYERYLPVAMKQEVHLFFETILCEDRSVLELIDADYSVLNSNLAAFYGIEPRETGKSASLWWLRHELPDDRRGGVLTMAAVLTMTSNPTRTSPVKRGKWLLETILGTPPPPPPPLVPELEEEARDTRGLTLRQQLEVHRENQACAGCHARMDPLGLALENFDAIGKWRDQEGDRPIDVRATLADGRSFAGAAELKQLLLERKDQFVHCLAEQLLTYALGRELDYYDAPAVREIAEQVARDEYRFSRLILEIVRSYPFQYRRSREYRDE